MKKRFHAALASIIGLGLNLVVIAGAHSAVLPRFPPGSVWNQNITSASVHPQSNNMISTLSGLGGFGNGRLQIDFSFKVVHASSGVPVYSITSIPGDDYYLPDCEPLGTGVPVPSNASIEGNPGLSCDVFGEDCHLLIVQGSDLFEVYRANVAGGMLQAQCLAKWQLNTVYPEQGRGEHCTSADAAGFPIAPLLFNADEIAASLALDPAGQGDIGHAIRFILPNARMASDLSLGGVSGFLYVRPATHAGAPSGPAGSVPYGSRLRLRHDFSVAAYPPAARVILNSMKRYGMVLADGGIVALTAEDDFYTTTKWVDLDIDSRVFDGVAVSDFEVIDTGSRIAETYDCVRSVLPSDVLFMHGFESQMR